MLMLALVAPTAAAVATDVAPSSYTPTPEQRALAAALPLLAPPPGRNVYPLLNTFGDESIGADERKVFCPADANSCLDHARKHEAAIRVVLDKHPVVLAKVESIANYDIWWNTNEPLFDAPLIPRITPLQLWPADAALRFVGGDEVGGLSKACTAAATFRRMHAHTNTMIDHGATLLVAQRSMKLSMEMLAAKSPSTPVPAMCGQAFLPPTAADVDFRAAAGFEAAVSANMAQTQALPGMQYLNIGPLSALAGKDAQDAMLAGRALSAAAVDIAPFEPERLNGDGSLIPELRRQYVAYITQLMERSAGYVTLLRKGGDALQASKAP
ncbi:hypothetical protein VI08_16475 [Luteibacter yeojuensis]|uniref:Uncharacterized protein n=2 Tax=Luteibacter yeojuensis TaxID=345309 RepID=A0A0F3KC90_9GAMM|nr:hypothetical protein VI08_16475 [Luteibacter yeojuensis]